MNIEELAIKYAFATCEHIDEESVESAMDVLMNSPKTALKALIDVITEDADTDCVTALLSRLLAYMEEN